MNKQRRKQLSAIQDRILAMKADLDALLAAREGIASDLETLRDEEQEAFDNLSESLQQGERGQDMEAAVDSLTSALDALNEIDLDVDLDEIVGNVEDARGAEA